MGEAWAGIKWNCLIIWKQWEWPMGSHAASCQVPIRQSNNLWSNGYLFIYLFFSKENDIYFHPLFSHAKTRCHPPPPFSFISQKFKL